MIHTQREKGLPPCALKPALRTTNDPGAPDTFWTKPGWKGFWRGIEFKKDGASQVRPEQEALISLGHIDPAWSLEQVQDILRRANEEREAQRGDT